MYLTAVRAVSDLSNTLSIDWGTNFLNDTIKVYCIEMRKRIAGRLLLLISSLKAGWPGLGLFPTRPKSQINYL